MKTVKRGVLEDMLKQLERYCELFCVSMTNWKTYDGEYLGSGRYELDRENETDISLGDCWLARYDCARFFYTDITLDESFSGKKLYLNLDFGGEIIVRLNGKIVTSVSSRMNSGWVARDTVNILAKDIVIGKPMRVELEACVDSGGFCDAAIAGAREHEYKAERAEPHTVF